MTNIPGSVRQDVLRRDGYRCLAPRLDPQAGWCRDAFGNIITGWPARDRGPVYIQMSHTKPRGQLALSRKAESEPRNLISLCPFHHTGTTAGSNWEAVHRESIRDHLERLYR